MTMMMVIMVAQMIIIAARNPTIAVVPIIIGLKFGGVEFCEANTYTSTASVH